MKSFENFKNEALTRQLDLIPVEVLDEQINIIGAGAIGSFVALSLAKMGFSRIKVWDFDIIDTVNMNSQFYRFKDIGKPKVEALRDLVKDFTEIEIEIVNERWQGELLEGIVIMAADSMATRSAIYMVHSKSLKCKLLIDSRMGAETSLLYSIRPLVKEDMDSYEKTLYSDDEAIQERCTAKSTIHCALALSSLIVSSIKGFLVDKKVNKNIMFDVKESDMITHRINR